MIPLHIHSNYSLLKGTTRISELIEECKTNSIPAIALIDINGMYGLIQFSKTALEYAKNKGLGSIITQPDMYSVEDLGLIKIDLLSQRSLGVLRDSMDNIKKNYNK